MKRLIGLTVAGLLVISIFSSFGFANAQVTLKDISGHLFEYEIKKLVEANVIKGYADGTFKPEGLVTRADISIMIVLGKKLTLDKPAVSPFKDVPTTHYAYGHIVAAQKAGYLKGYPDGTFRPAGNVTRAELAAILGQAKGLAAQAARITAPIAFSQDESAIPWWAAGFITLGVSPSHQYITHRAADGFRLVAPLAAAIRAEVAYGVHQIINPPKFEATVNVAMAQEPDTLHSWIGSMAAMMVVWNNMGLATVGRDQNWALYPGSMKEIPTVENGLWKVTGDTMDITYRIREGLKFHDGKPVTIDDWAYSFMVFMDSMTPVISRIIEKKVDLTKGTGAHGIKGFDILNPYAVKVYFKELDWRVNLGLIGMGLYPKHIVESPFTEMKKTNNVDIFRKDENMARKPIGIGAYKLVEWKAGSHMILERYDDFILGPALFKNMVFRFIPDTTALLARIISGKDIDVTAIGITFDQGMQLETRKSPHTRVNFVTSLIWEHIGVNMDNPILSDFRVRKAFILAIDRESVTKTLFAGRQPVAHGFYAPQHWAYDDMTVVKHFFNPAESRRLLEEAGWKVGADGFRSKDGKRLTIILETTAGNTVREQVQSILKAQLKDVGIDLDISKNRPPSAFFATAYFYGRKWPDMVMFAWISSPTSIGDTIFRQDMIPTPENEYSGQNIYGWRNAEATDLLVKASREMSDIKRKEYCARAQQLMTEELPVIPLYYRVNVDTSKINLASVRPLQLAGQYITWNSYNWYWR